MRGCTADGDLNVSKYSKPLPWIGLYVAAASLLLASAMAADTFSGFRRRKLWFPSRFFTLNATTLTLLGVATKFPVDLNTSMPRRGDQLAKLSGTALICTAMGNLMPSLGAMDDSDILSNVVALGILVITVIVNICIQMGTGVIYVYLPEHAIVLLFMLVLLVILISSALTVTTTKRLLEQQYDSKHKQASSDEGSGGGDKYDVEKLRGCVKKYWLMAHTCRPEYVLGRSATCTASGAFCLLSALIFAEALVRSFIRGSRLNFCSGTSDYRWASTSVLVAQATAIFVGTIAPAYRWFNAVNFRSPESRRWSCRSEFRVEKYWVQRLVEWKQSPLPFQIGSRWRRKVAHDSKRLVLSVLIRLQAGVVLVSKFVRLASILPVSWLNQGRKLFGKLESSPSTFHDESGTGLDLRDFVLHLEGEGDLVELIMRSGRRDTEEWIQMGRNNKPATLIEHITKFSTLQNGFEGASAFDSDRVPSLVPEEPPNCWALPVVTLTSIAAALPYIDQKLVESLRRGVSEGLRYVRLVEKNLDEKGLTNMMEAADIVWLGVDLYDRWLDEKLHSRSSVLQEKNGKKIVEKLGDIGKDCVVKFWENTKSEDETHKNPLEWPEKILAANCMYRVSRTILQDYDDKHGTDGNLFVWLRMAISDMLGACLTNLPRVIYMECFCSAIEVREERVRDAALLLGEAENILKILGNPEVACLFPDKKEYIDDWRDRNKQNNPSSLPSTSSNNKSSFTSDELNLSIE